MTTAVAATARSNCSAKSLPLAARRTARLSALTGAPRPPVALTPGLGVPSDLLAGARPGDLAKHRTRHQARAARVVVIEEAADQLPGRVQAGDRLLRHIEHPPVGVDPDAAKGKGDTAGRAERLVGRLFERHRPVGLLDREALGGAPVLDRRIVRDVALNRGVVLADRLEERRLIDRRVLGHLVGQLLDGVRGYLGD